MESNRKPLVWITGAGGLIGNYLVETAPACAPEYELLPLARGHLDLTDFAAVRSLFLERPPGAVIHCAAMSRSPECQANPDLARRVNVEATALLAELAAQCPFIFFSTDLVFDGAKGNYDENAEIRPLNVYGETKAEAEAIVLSNPGHTVVRTSLNGGTSPTGNRGFNEEMRRAWQAGQTLKCFVDEFRCPIPAEVTARAVWELLRSRHTGLFHLAGAERLSRYQIAQLIADRWPLLTPKIQSASLSDYEGPPRPRDTSLNCSKIQGILPFQIPGLGQWLREHPNEPF